jgi:hypothetical protein
MEYQVHQSCESEWVHYIAQMNDQKLVKVIFYLHGHLFHIHIFHMNLIIAYLQVDVIKIRNII